QTTDGTPPLTFSVSIGALPNGLSLDANTGAITGTPGTVGGTTFTIKVTDTPGSSDAHPYTVTINAPVTVSPASLPNGVTNVAYNAAVSGSGGTGALTFSVSSGVLPTGLKLDKDTGAITGTPTVKA